MSEHFRKLIAFLEPIVAELKLAKTLEAKHKILSKYVRENPSNFLDTIEKRVIYLSLVLIEQDKHLFQRIDAMKADLLFQQLEEVESFYSPIGGIVGYHLTFLKLVDQKNQPGQCRGYEKPEGLDLTKDSEEVSKAVRYGIELLHTIGEIYPVAGAGDRLNLTDENTAAPLPAAVLNFLGFTLLKGLIRDLQAREFLYYKLTGKQILTPVILMTSHEKNNDHYIKTILRENNWFNRPEELFFHILQPLVPVISLDGLWAIQESSELILKPGGHGVIWKLAENKGALDWFLKHNRKKALVRQINNPIAGIDNGLLAFSGIGSHFDKAFGFATCARLLGASEGVDVLIEENNNYSITNIEYTEFERCGIKDIPDASDSHVSIFPANTNILFADIAVLKETLKEHPFPGLLVNLKSQTECLDKTHQTRSVTVGRVESTMQNIADYIITTSDRKLTKEEKKNLRTFVTLNHRYKTISTTKKLANDDKIIETPEGAFYDLQRNAYELFNDYCRFSLEQITHEKAFIKRPPFIIYYHPALGPLYSVIQQKIQGGRLAKGSELRLEIAELYMENTSIEGSLVIHALDPLGNLGSSGEYSKSMGKCILKNVKVENAGVDYSVENCFWKADITRKEVLCIELEGNAEFFAEDVFFKGPFQICVPHGHRMIAGMTNNKVYFSLEKIDHPTWSWSYSFDKKDRVELIFINH